MGENVRAKFKYVNPQHSKKGGLKNVFVRIRVVKCSTLVMWYRDKIGKEFDAELKPGSFYVLFNKVDGRTDGGLINLEDAEIINKFKI